MRFERIYIEITKFCGLKCAFCPNAAQPQIKSSMDLALFKSICEQIEGKARRICLHILGDPLSVENLRDYVNIAKGYNLSIDLVSNGLFLEHSHFDMLCDKPFSQVSFSLSAFLANRDILGRDNLYRILEFCDFSVAKGSKIFINLRLHSKDILKKSHAYMDMISIIARHFNMDIDLDNMEKVRLAKKVLLVPKKSFEWVNTRKLDSIIPQIRHCEDKLSEDEAICDIETKINSTTKQANNSNKQIDCHAYARNDDCVESINSLPNGRADRFMRQLDSINKNTLSLQENETIFASFKESETPPISWGGIIHPLSSLQGNVATEAIRKQQKYANINPQIHNKTIESNIKKPFCYGSYSQIGILHNGDVVPCCIDYSGKNSFGNINEVSLDKILNSDSFKAFKANNDSGMPGGKICQTCGYRNILE